MRTFIAVVEESGTYYNCKFQYEIRDNYIYRLEKSDIRQVLNNTDTYPNLNLCYSNYQRNDMSDYFHDGQVIVIDLESADLETNIDSSGYVNKTEYKIDALRHLEAGKIRSVSEEGLYYLLTENDYDGDVTKNQILTVKDSFLDKLFIFESEPVYLISNDQQYVFGPYHVIYNENYHKDIINTHLNDSHQVLTGCEYGTPLHRNRFFIESPRIYEDFPIGSICKIDGDSLKEIDLLDDNRLLESIRNIPDQSIMKDGRLDLSDVDAVMKAFAGSDILNPSISESVREDRRRRLSVLLKSESDLDDTYRLITETIGIPALLNLITRYPDSDKTNEIISEMIRLRPALLNSFSGTKAIQSVVSDLYEEANVLRMQNDQSRKDQSLIDKKLFDEQTAELNRLREEVRSLQKDLQEAQNNQAVDYEEVAQELKDRIEGYEERSHELERYNRALEEKFQDILSSCQSRILDTAVDGFIANRVMDASSQWNHRDADRNIDSTVSALISIEKEDLQPRELIDYIVRMVQIERPDYDRNLIINLVICTMQGFITILSGEPGCGKTSFCNLLGKVLGLNKVGSDLNALLPDNQIDARRYIPVSVERGWTSKRDFIGYYNPMTKEFDQSNRLMYDALSIMNKEADLQQKSMPYIVLLDEANLSPMEYYWADFMNLCDGIDDTSVINLGGSTVFRIPESLHFIATINNDHTTETLSPRLLDRAMIVTLPRASYSVAGRKIRNDEIRLISWKSISDTFLTYGDTIEMPHEIANDFKQVRQKFEKLQHDISPRVDIAIAKYCSAAGKLFEDDQSLGRSKEVVALDYAVMQKLMPKLSGYGDEYRENLIMLRDTLDKTGLYYSSRMLLKIIERGDNNMRYYQFFA